MSNWERHGTRDMSLSLWHRQMLRQRAAERASAERGYAVHTAAEGEECGMIDIDWLEYCSRCATNLFLVEAARDIRKLNKVARQTALLAVSANIPAYIVLYTPTDDGCSAKERCRRDACQHGISEFKVRQIAPLEGQWRDETPVQFADFVLDIHQLHRRAVCGSRYSPREAELRAADPPAVDIADWPEVRLPGSGLPDHWEVG